MEDLSFSYPGAKLSGIQKFLSHSLPILFVSEPERTVVNEYQYKIVSWRIFAVAALLGL